MPRPQPDPTGPRRGPPARRPPSTRPGGRAPIARETAGDGLERLQKVLATAGIGSRRACEELITAGRVEVDRTVVTQLGTRVDPRSQEIRVDGERLPRVRRVVYLLNKPVGVVTTNYDPAGRPRAVDLVPGDQRLFAVGRLDRSSEGLLLITNDGELANLLAHPRYGVEKKYLVQIAGVPTPEILDQLRQGIRLAEGEVQAKRVSVRSQHKQSTVLEMVLDEGRNREIRRMLARLGHKVHQLKRVAIGGLSLGNLLPGQSRPLAWSEIDALRRDALAAVGSVAAGGEPAVRDFGPRNRATTDRRGRTGARTGGRAGGSGRVGGGRVGGSDRAGGGRAGGGRAGGGRAGGGRIGGSDAATGGRPRDDGPGGGRGRPTGRPGKPRRPGKASTWRKARGSGGPPGGVGP